MRWSWALLLGALALLWLVAVTTYGDLPARVPLHFDLAGHPDRWGERSWASWLLLPGIATLLTGLFLGVGLGLPWLARHQPGLINLPRKAVFLGLSADARVRVVAVSSDLLCGCAVLVDLLLTAILWGTARVARGAAATLPAWLMVPFLAGIVVLVLGCVRASVRAIEREAGAAGG